MASREIAIETSLTADGIRATEVFAQDADYDGVAAWYQQITRAAEPPIR